MHKHFCTSVASATVLVSLTRFRPVKVNVDDWSDGKLCPFHRFESLHYRSALTKQLEPRFQKRCEQRARELSDGICVSIRQSAETRYKTCREPIISDPYSFRRDEGGGELGLRRCLSSFLSTSRRRRASHKVALFNSFVQMPFYSSFCVCRRTRRDPTCSFVSRQRGRIAQNAREKKEERCVLRADVRPVWAYQGVSSAIVATSSKLSMSSYWSECM